MKSRARKLSHASRLLLASVLLGACVTTGSRERASAGPLLVYGVAEPYDASDPASAAAACSSDCSCECHIRGVGRDAPGLYVLDVQAGCATTRMQVDVVDQPRPLGRLDGGIALLSDNEERLGLLDLSTGACEWIARERLADLLCCRGGEAYLTLFAQDLAEGTSYRSPVRLYRLRTGERGGELTRLWERPVARVWFAKDDGFWVATYGAESEVWCVPLAGEEEARKICTLGAGWDPHDTHAAFSPDGSRLAFGTLDRERRPARLRLATVTLTEGVFVEQEPPLSEGQAGFSYSPWDRYLFGSASLEPEVPFWYTLDDVAWADTPPPEECPVSRGEHGEPLVPAEPRIRFTHDPRLRFGRRQIGAFVEQERGLYARRPGRPELEVLSRDSFYRGFSTLPSPDGRWLAVEDSSRVVVEDSSRVVVVDSVSGATEPVAEVWTYCHGWLPLAEYEESSAGLLVSAWGLHAELGRRVEVEGLAKHSHDGPCLQLSDGDVVYLPEWSSFRGEELGQPVRVAGVLCAWDGSGRLDGVDCGRWYYWEYALRDVRRLD